MDLLQWFINLLIKNVWWKVKNEIISSKELAEELHKPIIRKFNKRKVHLPFIDNIWGTDLADMQLVTKFNKGFRFLLCVNDIYSKFAWVIPLKDKKRITNNNAFLKNLDESNRKPSKIWLDKGSEFYNRSIKSFLQNNNIEMYSTHNERKSVIVERFIRTLKNKLCKYMTSVSKNVYIDKLDDFVNKYNNTYHSTIKMKPADVKRNTHILTLLKKLMIKILNLKLVIMLEYQNIKVFLQKVTSILVRRILFRGHMLLMILTEKKLLEVFNEKELQKTN